MSVDGSVKRNRIQLNSDFAEIIHGIVGGQALKEMAQKEDIAQQLLSLMRI